MSVCNEIEYLEFFQIHVVIFRSKTKVFLNFALIFRIYHKVEDMDFNELIKSMCEQSTNTNDLT